MDVSRRAFAGLSVALAAGLALPRRAWADPEAAHFFDWVELKPGAWAITGPANTRGLGGNSTLIVGKDAALLIDTKMAALGRWLRIEASEGQPKGITHVVNTHHHADHSGGNSAFMGEVILYAHEKAVPRIMANFDRYASGIDGTVTEIGKVKRPQTDKVLEEASRVKSNFDDKALKPESFIPNKVVQRDTSLDIGGVQGWLRHYGPGHTDNDMVVHFPDLNILVMGDLVFNKLHPYMDASAGCNSTSWQEALRRAMNLCDDNTIVVPGHGDVTNKSALQAQIDYFDKLRQIVKYAKDVDGMSREEASKIKTGAFEGMGYEQMLPNSITVIYDELSKT